MVAHSRLTPLYLLASRVAQLSLRRGPWSSRCVHNVALGSAQSCTAAHSCLTSLHLGASRAPSRCVASVALSSAQSCTAAHSRLASLHLVASRAAQLAAASRPLAVLLREERRAWFSSKLHVGPQPPRVTPTRSVACCAAPLRRGPWPSRCVHGVAPGSAQSCTADHSRLASLHLGASRAAQLAAAASRHSTSERHVLPSTAASRPLAVPLRA